MPEAARETWAYVHSWRMLVAFVGASMLILAVGLLLVLVAGSGTAALAGILLAFAIFVLFFAVLLFVPPLVRQGAQTYRLVVERPPEDVQETIRSVMEERGYRVRVESVPSRSARPPKVVIVEGASARFLLTPISRRLRPKGAPDDTVVVQIGARGESDAAAKALREIVTSRLVPSTEGVE